MFWVFFGQICSSFISRSQQDSFFFLRKEHRSPRLAVKRYLKEPTDTAGITLGFVWTCLVCKMPLSVCLGGPAPLFYWLVAQVWGGRARESVWVCVCVTCGHSFLSGLLLGLAPLFFWEFCKRKRVLLGKTGGFLGEKSRFDFRQVALRRGFNYSSWAEALDVCYSVKPCSVFVSVSGDCVTRLKWPLTTEWVILSKQTRSSVLSH